MGFSTGTYYYLIELALQKSYTLGPIFCFCISTRHPKTNLVAYQRALAKVLQGLSKQGKCHRLCHTFTILTNNSINAL